MNRLRFQQVLIVLLVFSAFYLFKKARAIDTDRHAQVVGQISELKRLSTVLEENVLKARIGLLNHYDPLVDNIARLKTVYNRLMDSVVDQHELAAIEGPALGFRQLLKHQENLIERFKSENAILRNSLAYFPTAVERLRHKPEIARTPAMIDELSALLENVLICSIHGTRAHRMQLRQHVHTLTAARDDLSAELRDELDYCLAHARRIDEYGQNLAVLLQDILDVPSARTIEAIFTAHNAHFEGAVREANFSRVALYVLCIGLVVYSAWVLIALKRTARELNTLNATLEERIAQRIKELCEKNTQLQNSRQQIEITNQRLATSNSALEQANSMLERKNAELDEFTYVASHDLQEPLRKMISFSKLLQMDLGGDLPDKAEKDLNFITDAAARMQQLVQDLLQLSRAGRSAMKRENVDLDDCVRTALDSLSLSIEESAADIHVDPLPVVFGDRTMLTQLYQNLISNAIKFKVPDRNPEIHLTAEQEDDGWRLGVRDNGIGMKTEYCEQIFAAFKRLHGRSEYEGTGIGLAICRKTVERHGGSIGVTSNPGEGALFTFKLPRHSEEVACTTEANETSSSSSTMTLATRS